jgi:ankyrin repeat protein
LSAEDGSNIVEFMRMNRWPAALALSCLAAGAAADDTLARLIQAGDRDAALALIESGADVNAAQGDGTTPLHWAVYKIDAELTAKLLQHGAHAAAVNRYGSSPLAEATKVANAELVKLLLDAGAAVEAPNEDGQTALMLAARAGATQVAQLLVERGADVNARETWRAQTPLMWAADGGYHEIVELLIANGADVHGRAAANAWGVQITSEPRAQYRPTGGLTPLLYAARSGCTACVVAILDAGASIDTPNPDGVTPLMVAIDNFAFDTAALLLERGANPHAFDWWGRTALYVAADMSTYGGRAGTQKPAAAATALDVARALLAAGVNPNPQLNMHRPGRGGNSSRFVDDLLTTGATPLLRAAIGHDVELVRELLAHGALVDLPNVMGVTPLMGAAGVGVSGRDRRMSLNGDVQSRSIATLQVLLAAGAAVNARVTDITSRTARIARSSTMSEREGQTALFGAVRMGWGEVVQYLLEHGADSQIADALGKSPLDVAQGNAGGRDNTVSPEIAALLTAAAQRD